jgi:hypothetical protein
MIRGINEKRKAGCLMFTKTINPEDWLTTLRENGCKVTEAQAMLVRIFAHSEYPLSAEQAWEAARQSRPETGRATVYRIVEKLEGLGLLRRVHGYKGCSHFMPVLPEAIMESRIQLFGTCTACLQGENPSFISQGAEA